MVMLTVTMILVKMQPMRNFWNVDVNRRIILRCSLHSSKVPIYIWRARVVCKMTCDILNQSNSALWLVIVTTYVCGKRIFWEGVKNLFTITKGLLRLKKSIKLLDEQEQMYKKSLILGVKIKSKTKHYILYDAYSYIYMVQMLLSSSSIMPWCRESSEWFIGSGFGG